MNRAASLILIGLFFPGAVDGVRDAQASAIVSDVRDTLQVDADMSVAVAPNSRDLYLFGDTKVFLDEVVHALRAATNSQRRYSLELELADGSDAAGGTGQPFGSNHDQRDGQRDVLGGVVPIDSCSGMTPPSTGVGNPGLLLAVGAAAIGIEDDGNIVMSIAELALMLPAEPCSRFFRPPRDSCSNVV
mgnify:CR=1 FL=1